MRIAIVIPGGLGVKHAPVTIPFLYDLIERLSQFHEIRVYSLARVDEHKSRLRIGNFQVYALSASPTAPLPGRFYRLLRMVSSHHRRHSFHLLHGFWGFPAGFATVLLGTLLSLPAVVTLMGGETAAIPAINYGNLLHPRLRRFTRWTCRRADRLCTLTRFQHEALSQLGITGDETTVIPIGANATLFKPAPKTLKPPYRFLHVGNLTEVKDQITLLKAFCQISQQTEAELRIIGPDYLDGQLQQLAGELEIADRVSFLGKLEHGQLPHHYRWAHFLLHTSLHEGQGVVIAEAAASGVVVSGTRVGLIADLGGKYFATAAVGDANTLAQQVLRLIHHPDQYFALQKNALNWAISHDIDWTAEQYHRLYQQLKNGK